MTCFLLDAYQHFTPWPGPFYVSPAVDSWHSELPQPSWQRPGDVTQPPPSDASAQSPRDLRPEWLQEMESPGGQGQWLACLCLCTHGEAAGVAPGGPATLQLSQHTYIFASHCLHTTFIVVKYT